MLVSHLATRPASEISKLVHSFRRRHDIVSSFMQPFGLCQARRRKDKRVKHVIVVCGPTQTARRLGGWPRLLAYWGSRVSGRDLGAWAVFTRSPGRRSLGRPGAYLIIMTCLDVIQDVSVLNVLRSE